MAKDVKAGGAYVELGLRQKLDAGLQAAAQKLRSFGKSALAIGGSVTAAATAAFASAMFAGSKFAEAGDMIGKMAARTGIGAEALQELGFAAQQSGTDLKTIEDAAKRMATTINGSSGALAKLGIDPEQLQGKATEDQLQMIGDALAGIDDASRKAAIAQEIFGRAGTKLLPLFNSGPEGMAALRNEARDLGLVLSATDVSAAEALQDAFGRAGSAAQALMLRIGASVAEPLKVLLNGFAHGTAAINAFIESLREGIDASPIVGALTTIVETGVSGFRDITKWVSDFIVENQPLIQTLTIVAGVVTTAAAGLAAIGASALAVGVVLPMVSSALATIAGVLSSVFAPALAIAAAVAGVGAAIYFYKDTILIWASAFRDAVEPVRSAVGELLSIARDTFGGILSAITAGDFELAVQILWAGIKTAFFTGAAMAVDAFYWLLDQGQTLLSSLADTVSSWAASLFAPIMPAIEWVSSAFTTVFGGTFDYVRELITNFASFTSETFGALGNAIANGNLSLAFDILWATAKLAFVSGIGVIRQLWSGFTVGLSEVWQTLSHTIVSVFRSAMGMIAGVMQSALSSLSSVASTVAEYDPTGVTAKVAGALDTVAGLYGAAERDMIADQKAADAARLAAQIANGQASLDAEKRINADIAASRAERDALIAKANEGPAFVGLKATSETQKAELAVLVAQARDAATVVSEDQAESAAAAQDEALAAGGGATKQNAGSFSAIGAALLGMGGGNVQDKIARNTEKTVTNTGRMVEAVGEVVDAVSKIPSPKFT